MLGLVGMEGEGEGVERITYSCNVDMIIYTNLCGVDSKSKIKPTELEVVSPQGSRQFYNIATFYHITALPFITQ